MDKKKARVEDSPAFRGREKEGEKEEAKKKRRKKKGRRATMDSN